MRRSRALQGTQNCVPLPYHKPAGQTPFRSAVLGFRQQSGYSHFRRVAPKNRSESVSRPSSRLPRRLRRVRARRPAGAEPGLPDPALNQRWSDSTWRVHGTRPVPSRSTHLPLQDSDRRHLGGRRPCRGSDCRVARRALCRCSDEPRAHAAQPARAYRHAELSRLVAQQP